MKSQCLLNPNGFWIYSQILFNLKTPISLKNLIFLKGSLIFLKLFYKRSKFFLKPSKIVKKTNHFPSYCLNIFVAYPRIDSEAIRT